VTLLNEETYKFLTVLEQTAQGHSPALSIDSSGHTTLDMAEPAVRLLKSALPINEGGNPQELLTTVAGIHQQRHAEFVRRNQRCVDLGVTSDPFKALRVPSGFMESKLL